MVDRASVTTSAAILCLAGKYGIAILPSAPYRHSTIGRLERWHATVGDVLATHRFASKDNEFSMTLPMLKLAYDAATSASADIAPFFVRTGLHANLPTDTLGDFSSDLPLDLEEWVGANLKRLDVTLDAVMQKLRRNAVKRKIESDQKRDVSTHFRVGDRVRLVDGRIMDGATRKGVDRTHGPFWIQEVLPQDNYMIANREKGKLKAPVHLNQLLAAPAEATADTAAFDGARSARRLLKRRVRLLRTDEHELGLAAGEDITEYRVRWCGLGTFADSWIAEDRLREYSSDLLDAYLLQTSSPPLPVTTLSPSLPQPAVQPGALRRSHFRHTAEAQASAPPPLALEPEPLAADSNTQSVQQSLDTFPVGTRVEVLYSGFEAGWWPGAVTRSRSSASTPPFPILHVVFDDPRYLGKSRVVKPWKEQVRKPSPSNAE